MKLKKELITHQIDGDYITVFTSDSRDEFHGILRTNFTGQFILDCLSTEKDINEEEILKKMQERFSGDAAQMKKDLGIVLNHLKQADAIIY